MSSTLPRAAFVLLPSPDGRFLAAIHSAKRDGALSLPGGKLEPGESFAQAARRKCFEEVGVRPYGLRRLPDSGWGRGWETGEFLAAPSTTWILRDSSEGPAFWEYRAAFLRGPYATYYRRLFRLARALR